MLAACAAAAAAAGDLCATAIAAVVALLWWPVLGGFAACAFVWALVYVDSERPGRSPPSPLRGSVVRMTRYR